MTLQPTLYNFGDTVTIDNQPRRVMSIHIYVSENGKLSERYYFGKGTWLTIHRDPEENQ
jgi:hypothetical protein